MKKDKRRDFDINIEKKPSIMENINSRFLENEQKNHIVNEEVAE